MDAFSRRDWLKTVFAVAGLAVCGPANGGAAGGKAASRATRAGQGQVESWPDLGPSYLVKGRYVLTNDPGKSDAGEIEDGAVLVSAGRIKEVGRREEIESRYGNLPSLGGEEFLVLPGLVDAHTHGKGFTHLRAGAKDEPLDLWALNAFSQKQISPYLDSALQNLMLVKSGVTTVLHSHYPRGFPDELEQIMQASGEAGLRIAFAIPYFDQNFFSYDDQRFLPTLPARLRQQAESYLPRLKSAASYAEFFESCLKRFQGSETVRLLHGPIGAQWVSLDGLRYIRQMADATDCGIHLHLVETHYQKQQALRQFGKTWAAVLDEIGFLGPGVSVAHGIWSTTRDIELYGKHQVIVCTNPSSNQRLKSGMAPVLEMKDGGVRVALGSDNMVLGGIEDFLWEMRICLNLHRPPGLDLPELSARDVLRMATINSAAATTFAGIGWLGAGQLADIVLLRLDRIHSPYLDPRIPILDAVLYQASSEDVDTVIVGGKVVVHKGKHVRLDREKLHNSIRKELSGARGAMPEMEKVFMEVKPYLRRFYQSYGPVGNNPHLNYIFNSRD